MTPQRYERRIAELEAELAALKAQEPVAWRYKCSRGHWRYVKGRTGWENEYPTLKPEPLYARPVPVKVPEGWKLVPVEPTGEMLRASEYGTEHGCDPEPMLESGEYYFPTNEAAFGFGRRLYKAMLAAAPP